MPQTALHDGEEIDSTDCNDGIWGAIHRHKPPVKVQCRGCGGQMWAKESMLENRFFSHVSKPSNCPSQGETAEHRELKSLLARAIRDLGWEARLEATPEDGDQGGWRADVLAVDPVSRRRLAFEVQLAGMTVTTGRERMDKYARDGIDTYWVTAKNAWWLWRIPGFLLQDSDGEPQVARGAAHFGPRHSAPQALALGESMYWQPPEDSTLTKLLADIFDGFVAIHEIEAHGTFGLEGCHSARKHETNITALVNSESVLREASYLQMLAAKDAEQTQLELERKRQLANDKRRDRDRKAWEAAVAKNHHDDNSVSYFEEFCQSQARVIEQVVPILQSMCGEDDAVLIGVVPRELSAPSQSAGVVRDDGKDWCYVNGDHTTADGALLWLKKGQAFGKRVAIVCPNPRFLRPKVDELWRQWGVTLYVETTEQAEELAPLIGYDLGNITVVGSDS